MNYNLVIATYLSLPKDSTISSRSAVCGGPVTSTDYILKVVKNRKKHHLAILSESTIYAVKSSILRG